MIKFRNENENSAGNFNSVSINWVKFYFSYETCVAVGLKNSYQWKNIFVHKNDRWPTTWKHLNWVDWWNKAGRLDDDEFNKVSKEAYKQVGF